MFLSENGTKKEGKRRAKRNDGRRERKNEIKSGKLKRKSVKSERKKLAEIL